MSGAYVAKPDATPVDGRPPGWSPLWPHPGPFPPGYTPEYSGILSAPSEISISDLTANVSLTLVDQDSYATNEPSANSATWEVDVGSSGGPSGAFSESDDFWVDSGIYAFSGVGVGDSILVSVVSYPFGVDWPIEETATINVVAGVPAVYHVELSCNPMVSADDQDYGSALAQSESKLYDFSGVAGVGLTKVRNSPETDISGSIGDTFFVINSRLFKKDPFTLVVRVYSEDYATAHGGEQYINGDWVDVSIASSASVSFTINVYKDDVLVDSYSDTLSVSAFSPGPSVSDSHGSTNDVIVRIIDGVVSFTPTKTEV